MIGPAGRMLLVAVGLAALLTYLLVSGATPDAALHERRLTALDSLVLNQAALHRDVLKARTGLLRSYDPVVAAAEGMHEAARSLHAMTATEPALETGTEELMAAVAEQEQLVERFKSGNALLQNSLAYFTHLASHLRRSGVGEGTAGAKLAAVTDAMLRFIGDPSPGASAQLTAALDGLAGRTAFPTAAAELGPLTAHGRLVLATMPAVDDALERLFASPVSTLAARVQDGFLAAFQRSQAQARLSRHLLYAAAVLLLGYMSILYLRLRRNARSLAVQSRALQARSEFEHLIAGISAEFIDLRRERIAGAVTQALERLARHVGADCAYVALYGHDAEHEAGLGWCDAEIGAPANWLEHARSLAEGRGAGQLRHGCHVVASTADLPDGSLRSALQARGVLSWLGVPLWHEGEISGLFGLDAIRAGRQWSDEDVQLLRTAGEILDNALRRERAEREMEVLERRLRHAQRMEAIGTLAGGIAHDFNNVLSAVLGYAELALGKLRRDSGAWRNVEEVRRAGQRGKGIVDQILAFSRRAETGRRPVRVRPVLDEAIGLLHGSLPDGITLQLADHTEAAVVLGDTTRLHQVIVNLVTNAAQAMAGQGTVEIELAAVEVPSERRLSHDNLSAGRYVRLSVADAGHGMDAATLERIFEPFFTTKPAGSGTGLGLATVHGIVADHGGALDVQSTPGRGSRFDVYLPHSDAAAVAEPGPEAALPTGQGETVLVVDDEEPLVRLVEEMLAALGYEPVGFDTARQALAACQADPRRFDLVLTDEVMPETSGTELASELHRLRPDLPILLMTGQGGRVPAQHLQAAGIVELLRKPLLSADLARALARHLRRDEPAVAAVRRRR